LASQLFLLPKQLGPVAFRGTVRLHAPSQEKNRSILQNLVLNDVEAQEERPEEFDTLTFRLCYGLRIKNDNVRDKVIFTKIVFRSFL